MKTSILAILVISTFSLPSHSAEFGIGASIKQNENTILVPVKFNDKFKIEGLVIHSATEQKNTYNNADVMKNEANSYSIGLGFYFVKPNTDIINTYFGVKIGYTKTDTKYSTISPTSGEIYVTEFEGNGHYVTPTVGFEYFPIKNISLGAEIGYNYYTSDTSDKFIPRSKSSFTDSGTTTNIIVRYYF